MRKPERAHKRLMDEGIVKILKEEKALAVEKSLAIDISSLPREDYLARE